MDDGTVLQKRSSLPAPPPLLPKSRSLDHTLHRDKHQDSEMVRLNLLRFQTCLLTCTILKPNRISEIEIVSHTTTVPLI